MKKNQPLPLSELQPGMTLASAVRDQAGSVLLPPGSVLSESNIASLGRRGIECLEVEQEVQEEPAAIEARRHHVASRVAHLFRRAGNADLTRSLREVMLCYRLEQTA